MAEVGYAALAHQLAPAQDRDIVGKGGDFAELVGDHQHRDLTRLTQRTDMAEHLVGFVGGEDRSRLVQDQEAAAEVELLEDLQLLLFASCQCPHRLIQRHLERHPGHEGGQRLALGPPVDDRGGGVAADHEVFGGGQRGHQGEMLIDHAEAEGVGGLRVGDLRLAPADQHLAGSGVVKTHHAFDERGFSGTVLAQQGMKCAGRHGD